MLPPEETTGVATRLGGKVAARICCLALFQGDLEVRARPWMEMVVLILLVDDTRRCWLSLSVAWEALGRRGLIAATSGFVVFFRSAS